jgi:hypothetical protein
MTWLSAIGKTTHSVMGHILKPAGEQAKLASL